MKLYTRVNEPADVRCYVPYTKATERLQIVIDCIRIQAVQPIPVKVDAGDAYWCLLRDTWAEGEPFTIVEQDVAVWQGAFRALTECDERWCTLPTMCHGRMITTTLGCARFSRQVIEENPGFWDDIPTTWFHLDANYADKMGWPFIKPHTHWPPATHLNESQWPDQVSTRYHERQMVWRSMENGGEPIVDVTYHQSGDPRRSERIAHATVDQYD